MLEVRMAEMRGAWLSNHRDLLAALIQVSAVRWWGAGVEAQPHLLYAGDQDGGDEGGLALQPGLVVEGEGGCLGLVLVMVCLRPDIPFSTGVSS
jgi:hypothetical protein